LNRTAVEETDLATVADAVGDSRIPEILEAIILDSQLPKIRIQKPVNGEMVAIEAMKRELRVRGEKEIEIANPRTVLTIP